MFFRKPDESDANEDSTPMVTLKNGSEAVKPVVEVTMLSLIFLIKSGRMVEVYELVKKAKNPQYVMFAMARKILSELELIDSDGSIPSSVRDIILSAVRGDG